MSTHLHTQVVHRSLVFALASDNSKKLKLEEILALQTTNEMVREKVVKKYSNNTKKGKPTSTRRNASAPFPVCLSIWVTECQMFAYISTMYKYEQNYESTAAPRFYCNGGQF